MTLIKQAFIISIYLIIFIIKLNRSSFNFSVFYYLIYSYIMVFIQNSRPLFIILLTSVLALYDIICIAWARKQFHTPFDICFFICILRIRVLKVLHLLKIKNLFLNQNFL